MERPQTSTGRSSSQRLSERSLDFAKAQYGRKFRLPSISDPIFTAGRPSSSRSTSRGRRPSSAASTAVGGGGGGASGGLNLDGTARGGGLAAVRGSRPSTALGSLGGGGSVGPGMPPYIGQPQPQAQLNPYGPPFGLPPYLPLGGGMPADMAGGGSYMWPGLFFAPPLGASQAAMYQMYGVPPPPQPAEAAAGSSASGGSGGPPLEGSQAGGLASRYLAAAASAHPPAPEALEPSPIVIEYKLTGGELMDLVAASAEAEQALAQGPPEELVMEALEGQAGADSSSSSSAPATVPASPGASSPRQARASPSLRPELLASAPGSSSSSSSPYLSPAAAAALQHKSPLSGGRQLTASHLISPSPSASAARSGGRGGSGGAAGTAAARRSTPTSYGSPRQLHLPSPTQVASHTTALTSSTVLGATGHAPTLAVSAAHPLAESLLHTLSRSISEAVALGLEGAAAGAASGRASAPSTYNINITLSIPTAIAGGEPQAPLEAPPAAASTSTASTATSPGVAAGLEASSPQQPRSPAAAAAAAAAPPTPLTRAPTPRDLRTVSAVADWEASETLRMARGLSSSAAALRSLPPPPAAHAYPLWFLLALVRSVCDEIESAGLRTLSASAAAASLGLPSPAAPVSAGLPFASPVRDTLSSSAPLPSPGAWSVNHSASLHSAWLWCLQAARDLRVSAMEARAWLQDKGAASQAQALAGGAGGLLSPSFPSTLDPLANTAAAVEAAQSGSPFGGLVQEDHILRLLRRLPTGHLPRATAIATKALLVRVLLALVGWGCLNDATATIMRLHIEEAVDIKVSVAAAARRGSHFGEVEAAAAAEEGGQQPQPADAALTQRDCVELVEAVLLEPLAVLPPASLSAFSQYGVDGLGGALGGTGSRFEVNYLITPDAVREAMREVAEGGKAGVAHPGAASDFLLSPSADLYPFSAGPFSPGLVAPYSTAAAAGRATAAAALLSPAAAASALHHPGHYSFFGPAAWECLAYARRRTPGHANLATVLATPKEALAAHFEFVEMCLKTIVPPPGRQLQQALAHASPAPALQGTALPFTSPLTPAQVEEAEGGSAAAAAAAGGDTLSLSPEKDRSSSSSALASPARGAAAAAAAEHADKAAAAVGAEVASVVGRSLLRDAQDRLLRQAAAQAGGSSSGEEGGALAVGAEGSSSSSSSSISPQLLSGGVRFMLVLLSPDGKSLMEEPGTGAPLLLRSIVPMLDVELALGSLSRSGRRHLGHTEAAAVQSGEASSAAVVQGIAASLTVSPLKSSGREA